MADVAGRARSRGALALADRQPRRGRVLDLRVGALPQSPLCDPQSAADGRAAAQWREAPTPCRPGTGGRAAAGSPDTEDRVPYAIACYAGVRRAEIHRLEWPEVL